MNLNVGDKVKYTFPMNVEKTINAIVHFKGETVIHLKSEEGILVKVQWKNFDFIQPANDIGVIYKN